MHCVTIAVHVMLCTGSLCQELAAVPCQGFSGKWWQLSLSVASWCQMLAAALGCHAAAPGGWQLFSFLPLSLQELVFPECQAHWLTMLPLPLQLELKFQ